MDVTLEQSDSEDGRTSHTVQIKNASREERLRWFFQGLDDESIDDAVDGVIEAVNRGDITEQEAVAGSRPYDRFHEEIADEYNV